MALLLLALLSCAHPLFALVAPDLGSRHASDERIARLEQQVVDAKAYADNAWMLTSSALVLMMTGPSLALFYCGLVRKKNVLSTMMQSFAMMALITVLWTVSVATASPLEKARVLSGASGICFCTG